jgi:hypothetical protein
MDVFTSERLLISRLHLQNYSMSHTEWLLLQNFVFTAGIIYISYSLTQTGRLFCCMNYYRIIQAI